MNYQFKEDQTEEYYRKLLLLNKVKPFLKTSQKFYIFKLGFCWNLLFKDEDGPSLCYDYAKRVLKTFFPEGEKIIATDPFYSYMYAKHILKSPFRLGEKAISCNCPYAYLYAKDVLKGRFLEGEKAIASTALHARIYAMHILHDRFPLGELAIINSQHKELYLRFLRKIGKEYELKIKSEPIRRIL